MVQAYLRFKPQSEQRMPSEDECAAFLKTMGEKPFKE
jgi:hypothetical protein